MMSMHRECSSENPLKLVMCLSHEVTETFQLSIDSKRRIDRASEIFKSENCDFLITSGWKYKEGMQTTLAHLMAKRAELFHYIPSENIMMETSSKDTVGEAVFLRQNFQNVQISKLIIVTSNWHQKRAREIFKFVFSEVNVPIVFSTICGTKKASNKEKANKSIEIFRDTFLPIQNRTIKNIYSKMVKSHKLYKTSDV